MKSSWAWVTAAGFLGLVFWGFASEVRAASGDADGTFTVTITRIEISKDGGATYADLFNGSQDINIAAANAGAVAAGLISNAALPPGTYNQIRVTLGSTLRIKGFVNNGANTGALYTNNDADGFDLSGAINAPGGDYAVSALTIPVANRVDTIAASIVVPGDGAPCTVRINFDATSVLSAAGNVPSLNDPTVTVIQN